MRVPAAARGAAGASVAAVAAAGSHAAAAAAVPVAAAAAAEAAAVSAVAAADSASLSIGWPARGFSGAARHRAIAVLTVAALTGTAWQASSTVEKATQRASPLLNVSVAVAAGPYLREFSSADVSNGSVAAAPSKMPASKWTTLT